MRRNSGAKIRAFVFLLLVIGIVLLVNRCRAGQSAAPKAKTASSAAAVQTAAQAKTGKLNTITVQRGKDAREKFQNDSSDVLHTASSYGIVGDAENLLWISSRGGAGIESSSVKEDASKLPVVQESEKDSPTSDSVWVRLSYDAYTPPEGENTWGHKDIMVFVDTGNAQDAVLAIQDPKEQTKWSVVSLPGYGSWLKKQIDIMLRVTKGL